MAKILMNQAQYELAKKAGLVKVEGGKLFLMPTATNPSPWASPPVKREGAPVLYDDTILPLIPPPVVTREVFEISDMKGKTFTSVTVNDDKTEMVFENDEFVFTFYHESDCCESVQIEDIVGDLNDLVGRPLDIVEVSR